MDEKIYTRHGDAGSTRRRDGREVRKHDGLLAAIGTLDELSSSIGLCLAAAGDGEQIAATLATVQQELFAACAMIGAGGAGSPGDVALGPASVDGLERAIDAASKQLPKLTGFIVPGGCELAARLHVARTVCRRAERRVVAAADEGAAVPPVVLQYLNRLSDWLFTLARLANKLAGLADTPLEG